MVKQGFALYLLGQTSPYHGYRLAVTHCEHYDPRYGQDLNGHSRVRLMEICEFIKDREAHAAVDRSDPIAPRTKR